MEVYIRSLMNCVLFNGIELETLKNLIVSVDYKVKAFSSNTIIAFTGEPTKSIGIVIDGRIEIHKLHSSGKSVTIKHFEAGDIFAESLVFSNKSSYPANVVAITKATVMFIDRAELLKLMHSSFKITENFCAVLSSRIHMLNEKLTFLTFNSIREKVVFLILKESKANNSLSFDMPYNRLKMAELLDIPRPSLSRELASLKRDELIDFSKNRFSILDLEALEAYIL